MSKRTLSSHLQHPTTVMCTAQVYWVVQEHQTSSKSMLLERARCREFSHKFGVFQANQTFSESTLLERAWCVELCHISLRWFKHIKPHCEPRESEMCRVLSHKFRHIELHQTYDIRKSKVSIVFSHRFEVVQAHRTSFNLFKKHAIRESEVC